MEHWKDLTSWQNKQIWTKRLRNSSINKLNFIEKSRFRKIKKSTNRRINKKAISWSRITDRGIT